MSYKIKNWHQFQHFKDRKPPWIKLYRDLLDDVHWHDLDPKAAKNLVMIWLIASEYDGALPDMKTLAFRLRVLENEAKSIVSKLSHWLIHDDIKPISDRYQNDSLEIETEKEKEREGEAKRATRLPTNWTPRLEDGTDELELDKFRDHWKAAPGQRGVKLDWDATWRNWLRRAAESKPKQQSRETPLETGLRIIKEMEDAEYQRSHASRDTLALSLQRQPSGQGDIPSPSGSQLRGLLSIDASITMPPKDWFDLEE